MPAEKLTTENPPRPNMEHFLSQDNSCHWVLVPQPIRAWWFKFLEIPEDDERSWTYPEGCIEIDGPESIVFSNFRAAKENVDTQENSGSLPA